MKKIVLLVLAAPLVLAACGGGSSAPVNVDPVAYVRHAASKTAGLPSEHIAMQLTATAAGQSLTMNGSGDFSNRPSKGTLQLAASVAGHNISIHEVVVGTTAYMSSQLFAAALPSGKTWLKLDMQQVGKSQGINYNQLLSQTPSNSLQRLEAAGTVTSVGPDTVYGTATTHYRVTNLDLSKVPQAAKLLAAAHVKVKYGPIDVWIGNADGYVRQVSYSASESVAGHSVETSAVMTFTKFGEAVNVRIPPARQTFDATGLATGGGLGG
jgi:hypothetical protein